MAPTSLVAIVLLGLLSACSERVRSVCTRELANPSAELTAEVWLAVMLRDFEPGTGRPVGEPLDSCERPSLDPTRREFGPTCFRPRGPLLPARPLSEDDLSVSPGPEGTVLVWVAVERFADGSAYGPLAWIEQRDAKLHVRALGGLRSATRDLRMELHDDWLLVYAKHCIEGVGCRPVVQILARERGELVTLALARPGVCTVPAEVELHRTVAVELSDGRTREYAIARSVQVLPNRSLAIDERLTVSESADSEPSISWLQLPVRRDGDRLVVPTGLWAEVQDENMIEMWPEF